MLEQGKETTRYGKYTYIEYARFADDLVILIDAHPRHGWLMGAVEKRLREELAELQVEINEEKSRIVDLGRGESFIKLCLVTAQRVGEIAGMRHDELDMKARTWRLPGSRTKNGHPHVVPLSDLTTEIIKEAIADAEEGEFVFPSGDGSLPAHALARTIGRAQEADEERPQGRFGIAHWTAHDLRRTVLTNMAKLGVQPVVIAHVANHMSVAKAGVTFAHYVRHGYEREMREALDLWADRLKAIVAGEGATVVPLTKRA